jgi:hypothetical protein
MDPQELVKDLWPVAEQGVRDERGSARGDL